MSEATDLYGLCTVDDDYVRERVRWVARLDDGEAVYQDDDRPGLEPASAWSRLKAYCEEQSRSIVDLRLQFRTHHVPLPSGKAGYYFAKTLDVSLGGGQSSGIRVGYVEGATLHVAKYSVPELETRGVDARAVDPSSPSLILNPGGRRGG